MEEPVPEELPADSFVAKGSWLFAQECNFVAGAMKEEMIPPASTLPEVAFCGKSNVGKSSLINALTNRKTLARVSHTPGRTQQINFFELGKCVMLADLPGYGYAKVSKKMRTGWNRLIVSYLKGRVDLRRVFVLVDARRGVKEHDIEVMKLLDKSAVPYQIVLTKGDHLAKKDVEPLLESVAKAIKKHGAALPEILLTSSSDRTGLDIVRAAIASLVLEKE
ncbi:MAG: YihA family ribosome biogenesis GTP-binding protein [Alphaproteobacteria bacterium]|nr:YihA family ribosome biogenesis GTP-binding protein [Alphaproteobacteria bacterium]